MQMQTQEQIKRKQMIIAISAAFGLFAVVYLGMQKTMLCQQMPLSQKTSG